MVPTRSLILSPTGAVLNPWTRMIPKPFWNEDWSLQAWYKSCQFQIVKFTDKLLTYLGEDILDIPGFSDDWIVNIWARILGPNGSDPCFPSKQAAVASIFRETMPVNSWESYKSGFVQMTWRAIWATYWSAWFRNAEHTTFNLPLREIERNSTIQVRMYPECSIKLGKIVSF